MWLLLKQQANKQWVKTLSTHSKLACWWFILYSEKNNNIMLAEVESRTQGSRPRPRTQKKIRGQGQGQPFRGQTLSRPRTEMLEAKAKDQGHKRKCSPKKKKGLHKNFSSDLHKKTFFIKIFKRFSKI